jgi:hypothetical protein
MKLAKKIANRLGRSIDVLIHGKNFPSNIADLSSIAESERRILEAVRTSAYWASLAGKYRGRAGFVIGNGPSLTTDDLTKICGQVSIASNKIYLAFDETPWRPNIYTIVDLLVWEKLKDDILKKIALVHIPSYLEHDPSPRIKEWQFLGVNLESYTEPFCFSDNVVSGLYGGHTVTYENIQIAAHLGLNPIYLIGCDHYYAGEDGDYSPGDNVIATSKNHFHPDYRKPGETVRVAPINEMNLAYEAAALYCKSNEINIYNATRGGNLEAFERRDLDEVLETISSDISL